MSEYVSSDQTVYRAEETKLFKNDRRLKGCFVGAIPWRNLDAKTMRRYGGPKLDENNQIEDLVDGLFDGYRAVLMHKGAEGNLWERTETGIHILKPPAWGLRFYIGKPRLHKAYVMISPALTENPTTPSLSIHS